MRRAPVAGLGVRDEDLVGLFPDEVRLAGQELGEGGDPDVGISGAFLGDLAASLWVLGGHFPFHRIVGCLRSAMRECH